MRVVFATENPGKLNEIQMLARPYDLFVGTVEYEGKIVKRFQEVES